MSIVIYKSTADLYGPSQDSSNSNLENYNKLYSGLRINIQPAGLEYVATTPDGAMGKIFRGFTTYSGCMIGMMLVSSGTTTVSGMRYSVIGLEQFTGGLGRTYELLLRLNTN